jgi:hypothetical protein
MPFCATLTVAFVALVIPFDRSRGLQAQICSLFLWSKGVTAWVMAVSKTAAQITEYGPREAMQFQR